MSDVVLRSDGTLALDGDMEHLRNDILKRLTPKERRPVVVNRETVAMMVWDYLAEEKARLLWEHGPLVAMLPDPSLAFVDSLVNEVLGGLREPSRAPLKAR